MGFSKEEHAKAGLPNTSSDCLWKLSGEEFFMEIKAGAVFIASDSELATEALRVDSDTHARNFERALKDIVPEEDVSVEALVSVGIRSAPIIIVGGPAVMDGAVREFSSDAYKENGLVLLCNGVFPLFRGHRGVHP